MAVLVSAPPGDITLDCIEWDKARTAAGYGETFVDGKVKLIHRVVYEEVNGPIPAGLVIDHLCDNRACINSDHLAAVSQWDNIRRGRGATAVNARKTACPKGHPLDGLKNDGKHRWCRTCDRERKAAQRKG
jgi:hypothetical protein